MREKQRKGIPYRRRRNRFKSYLPRGLPVMLIFVLTAVGTIMYLTARTTTAVNAFSVWEGQIQIVEEGIDPDAVAWGSDSKPVQLMNPEDAAPGVVRAMVLPYLTNAATGERLGGNLGELTAPSGTTMVLGDITFHFASDWSANWFFKDGFFYYRKVLNPGEKTTKLLSGLTLESGKEVEYENVTVKVDITADILQKEGDAPLTEWGVNVSGNTVSPK